MIERIARALATADGKDPDAPAWVKLPGGRPYGICWRDQYADKARAAIEAMRVSYQGDAFLPIECIEDAWREMIDVALNETSTNDGNSDGDSDSRKEAVS